MSEEMNRFILAVDAMTERHKEGERIFSSKYPDEPYKTDAERQAEFEAAYNALSAEEKALVAFSHLSAAFSKIVEEIEEVFHGIVEAVANACRAFIDYIGAIGNFNILLRNINKTRPQRKHDPINSVRLAGALRHLPNTVALR